MNKGRKKVNEEKNMPPASNDETKKPTDLDPVSPLLIQPQPSSMEVHKHPHHVTHKKQWGEYFVEFLMIFLAVFLGFVAENIRENLSDKEKEKQYMGSIVKDLETDTTNIAIIIKKKSGDIVHADSLLKLLTDSAYQNNTGFAYYYARLISITDFFRITNGTVQQLINSGGLRLVRKRRVVDSIQSYLNKFGDLSFTQQLEEELTVDYRNAVSKVFDVKVFEQMVPSVVSYNGSSKSVNALIINKPDNNPPLLVNDRTILNEMLMKVHYMKRNKTNNWKNLLLLNEKAVALINLIQQEYRLEEK